MIRLTVPAVGFAEVEEGLREVLASGWLTGGPKVVALEERAAAIMGARHAVAVSSGTAALHLAFLALGMGPGDEVLVPDYTFPAPANAAELCGARAVLCDVDPETGNLSPADLAARIGPRARAIVAVHQFGLPAEMDPILEIASRHGLPVIEDAACAIGASYRGRAIGTIGRVATFSFHPRKVVTTGEGGLVTTGDDALAERVRALRNHGMREEEGRRIFAGIGFNYRLSELHAVLGLAQLHKLDALVAERRLWAARLTAGLAGVPGLHTPADPKDRVHVYQSYLVRLDEGIDRDAVLAALRARGIEAAPGAVACHTLPYYRERYGYREGDLPASLALARQGMVLPLYPGMRDADLVAVVRGVREALKPVGGAR